MRRQACIAILVGAFAFTSTQSLARGGGGHSHSGGSYRSSGPVHRAPSYRAAPAYRTPVYRTTSPARYVPHQHYSTRHTPTVQHVRTPTVQHVTTFRNPVYAHPVRHVAHHFVSYRGRPVGIPPLLLDDPDPVILDVPELGQITVVQKRYAELYPLLLSNDQADHERAFAQLKEQAEREPESLVRSRAPGESWIEPMRNEPPGHHIKDGFGNDLQYYERSAPRR